MLELDGPAVDTFTFKRASRMYTSYVVAGADPSHVLADYEKWFKQHDDPDNIILWRRRPAWLDGALWTLSWRCAVVKAN